MKYTDIIKNSKFYIPTNLNLGYLLKDTEIMLLMTLIHCDELGIKVSIAKLAKFMARNDTAIKRALKPLRLLRLVSMKGYEPCMKQIALVYDSVNAAKSIDERKAWCEAYEKSEGHIEPLKKGQSDMLRLGQSEPLKVGQNEPSKKGQFEPTYKEDINKEDSYKEYFDNEYTNDEYIEYNTNNILKGNKPIKEKRLNRNSLKEEFEVVTEGIEENQNEPKSKIEGNDDSNRYQPFENNPSSSEKGNNFKQVIPIDLKGCSKVVRQLYSNLEGDVDKVLQELAASKPSEFRKLVAKLERNTNVSDDTKELAVSLAKAWSIDLY